MATPGLPRAKAMLESIFDKTLNAAVVDSIIRNITRYDSSNGVLTPEQRATKFVFVVNRILKEEAKVGAEFVVGASNRGAIKSAGQSSLLDFE